jgi:hypothetical protein
MLDMFKDLQCETYDYFRHERNPENGLVPDKTEPGAPCSTAVVGLSLTASLVAMERGYETRDTVIQKTLTTLRFFFKSQQSAAKDATGFKGFYYHFLDMKTGKCTWDSELSTIDTALLMAGILSVGQYFQGVSTEEREIRDLAKALYERVDWKWATNGKNTLSHGWTPEQGFLPYRWDQGYSEALILYVLALGSPTFPIEKKGYDEWLTTFEWKKVYDIEYLYAGPLFIHQLSHLWIDFRGIHDEFNQKVGIDYFENSRRATYVQQKYAIENPYHFRRYGELCWGFTASDGPGPAVCDINHHDVIFYNYTARGAPFGPDDGTVSPWAAATSLPFAPEIVIPTVEHVIEKMRMKNPQKYGFEASFNLTFPKKNHDDHPWVSPYRFGLNQGPVILMIENHETEMIWKLMKEVEGIQQGLKAAGYIRVASAPQS